jgi:hypothetical protein
MESSPWTVKGCRTVINRFMEARRKAKRETMVWHRRGFGYQYTCLELDMFKGGKFTKVSASKLDGSEEDKKTTASGKETFRSEKNIRAACQNVMVMSSLVYSDPGILARQKIFVAATEPLDVWHHDQSVACRSVTDTRKYLISQLANQDFLKTMQKVIGTLQHHSSLAYIGFHIPEEVFFVIAHLHTCDAHIVLYV